MSAPLMLYDGECALCVGSVQFVLRNERRPLLHFAPLQSALGRRLLSENGMNPERLTSFVIVEEGVANTRLAAARRLMFHLGGIYRIPWALSAVVPRFVGDAIYTFIFDRRNLWFGKVELCLPPDPDTHQRFADFPVVDA